jgi:GTP cyclohydrolase IA
MPTSATFRATGFSGYPSCPGWWSCSPTAPQVQERLTQQVADWLDEHLQPKGVGVVLAAEHLYVTLRGARAAGSTTVTSALHGLLLSDARAREEFFALAQFRP